MKDAIGSSLLLYIVVFIVGIVLILLVNSLAYSKAFKVKNRIINQITETGAFNVSKVDSDLATVGYELNKNTDCSKTNYYRNNNCSAADGVLYAGCNPNTKIEIINVKPTYDYCVYKTTLSDNSYYYSVVTFTHFELPLVGGLARYEVSGETKRLGINYDY